mgnify:FL=1
MDNEYGTYLLNKDNADTKYRYVDDVRIYQFLEEIHNLTTNNNIKTFDSSAEIQEYPKEQFAGLFQSFLEESAKAKDFSLSQKLESLAERFERLSDTYNQTNKDIENTLHEVQYVTHPVVHRISSLMNIQYGIWFDDYAKLNALLRAYGWSAEERDDVYRWTHDTSIDSNIDVISVSKTWFDINGRLKPFIGNISVVDTVQRVSETVEITDSNDLPF